MVAVLALALEVLPKSQRQNFVSGVSLGTTAWLAEENNISKEGTGSLGRLLNMIGEHYEVSLLGLASGLHFFHSRHQALRDYELGYVKEGVGAGAFTLLAQLQGASCKDLVEQCDEAMEELSKQSTLINPSLL